MGVGEDFSAFKDNYNIGTDLIGSISYRYKRFTRQLNTDFWSVNRRPNLTLDRRPILTPCGDGLWR